MTTIKLKGGEHKEPTKYESGQWFKDSCGDKAQVCFIAKVGDASKLFHLMGNNIIQSTDRTLPISQSGWTISELEATFKSKVSLTPISVTISED